MFARTALAVALLAASFAAGLAVAGTDLHTAPACGVERWSVKTLQDPAGKAIDLSVIKKTMVAALRGKTVQRGPGGSRGSGVESTFYEVRARLVSAKLEEDDDIHLVIKGLTTSGTMIVEFPTVACSSSAKPGVKTRMKNARNAFVAACGMPGSSSFTQLAGKATLRGIGFFDFLHGQTGVAPNGVELHPVLRFMDASCTKASSAPPPTTPPPTTPTPPPSPQCDPHYSGACVPPYPPDLNCADLRALGLDLPVRVVVIGQDPHELDRDLDGWGCE